MQIQQQKKIKPLRLYILTGMIAISAVVLLFVWAIPDMQQSIASTHWPTTQGSIITSEVVENSSYRGGRTSSIQLRYAFTVKGNPYIGSRIGYRGDGTGLYSSYDEAENIRIQHYPVGKKVAVYYNPIKPQESVLISGVGDESFVGFGVSAVTLLFAVLVWFGIITRL